MLERLGAELERVVVTEMRDHTYFAELHLVTAGGPVVVSSRPSDAIALAVRIGCPIYATEVVLELGGRVDEVEVEDDGTEEQILAEFQDFIDGVSPDDFAE